MFRVGVIEKMRNEEMLEGHEELVTQASLEATQASSSLALTLQVRRRPVQLDMSEPSREQEGTFEKLWRTKHGEPQKLK